MYSLRWLLFWSLLGCCVVTSVLMTLLQSVVFFTPSPPHQQVSTLWQPMVDALGGQPHHLPTLTALHAAAQLPTGWQVLGIAGVDQQAQLRWQQGEFPQPHHAQWQALLPGDLGAQLPIVARDDLADALSGRPNNGVELLAPQQFLLIKPLYHPTEGQRTGAVILALSAPADWQAALDWFWQQGSFWQHLLFQVLILTPLLLPAGVGLIWLISSRWRQQAAHVSQVIEKWSVGDFNHRLHIKRADETGQTLLRLNQLADSLQQLLAQKQQWAAQQERQLLASALHDTVKQQLFVNNLTLAGCLQQLPPATPVTLSQALDQAIAGNQQAFRQVSTLLDQLTESSNNTVASALVRQRIESIATARSWLLRLELPAQQIPILLLSVIDEALANIVKHADTSEISIFLTQSAAQGWYLQVRNQGVSPDDPAATGQGLRILSQRLLMQGGRLYFGPIGKTEFQLEVWLP